MIRDFREWTVELQEHSALEELNGCTVAIEAVEYLQTRILDDPLCREPLLPAVGGLPFGMKRQLKEDLDRFKEHGITPFFVFPGLDTGSRSKEQVFQAAEKAARVNKEAWGLYDAHEAENAVSTFGQSGAVKAAELLRYFQAILREENVSYQVAPYSACAQLAYLITRVNDTVAAIAGPSEVLLFDVDKVITGFNFEQGHYSWIRKQKCIQDLGPISSDQFIDACLLAGSSTLPTLPQLEGSQNRKQPKIRNAVDMILSGGRTGISVCLNYQDDPQFQKLNYLDNFRKSRLAVKHHIILTREGKLEPFDFEQAPGDMHEFIGQRLPDELYYYLSRGVISPKVLNWRTSGEILELPPIDGGESEAYRGLVRDQITPIRSSALSLLTYSINRFFQHQAISIRYWFDKDNETVVNVKEWTDRRAQLKSWCVREAAIQEQETKFRGSSMLALTVRSLTDVSFASKTNTTPGEERLSTKKEILYNAFWRFLQLREYVDEKHQLTNWGKVLATVLARLHGNPELEEAGFIAVELARLDLLNGDKSVIPYTGGPARGTEEDKQSVLLVSRIACLGRLRHGPMGFTGPLSRNLLGYHSITTTLRSTLRDLAEISLTTLLLNGDAARQKLSNHEIKDLGLDLPFLLPNDCALGVAVKSYLDELVQSEKPSSPEAKASIKATAQQYWFPQCGYLVEDMKTAFSLWDAVYAGVKVSDEIKDKKMWDAVNLWLEERR